MHRGHLASLIALAHAAASWAATVTYYWEVTWVDGSPDGFHRPVIGINYGWPCPIIEASVGDTVVVNMANKLGNQTTGIHFHGIRQVNSPFMDGSTGTSQCPVPPDHSMTYTFLVDTPGTYWYHSHDMGQYPDGLRGPLIVHDPKDPYLNDYQQDFILTVSDWYHLETPALASAMLEPSNTLFLPPRPNSVIVNEGSNGQIPVEAGKTYRLRMINFSALTSAFIQFSSGDMEIIATDATHVHKQSAKQILISAGGRYDALVTVPADANLNYPFLVVLDTNPDYTSSQSKKFAGYSLNFTGMLVTDSAGDMSRNEAIDTIDPFDDTLLKSYDDVKAYGPVTKHWVLDFDYCHDVNGYSRACFNHTTFIGQTVPSLYSAVSLGANNTQLAAYGQVNPFIVGYGEVLEIVINNHDAAIHPFHLHGHQFQVIDRPGSRAGNWTGHNNVPDTPVRRDTVDIYANSYAVMRIVADNPGVFLLHCHIEWHVEMGLTATLIEAPERLEGYKIPQDHIDVCNAMGIPTTGNAAGNADWADTNGFITVPPTVFTGAMYVA